MSERFHRLASQRKFLPTLVWAFFCLPLGVSADPFQPNADGQVVMEAENFDLNASAGGRDWVTDLTAGFVGNSAMQSIPDSFFKVTSNPNGNSPRLDYEVEYAAPVTVNVWVRGLGLSGSRDSIWIGIDANDGAALVASLSRGNYGWTTAGQLTIPAGVHTVNVWMREDGSIIDRVLLTPLSTVPSGDGPPESSRGASTPGNTPPDAFDDDFFVDEDTTNNLLSVLADNGSGADSDPDGDTITIVSADNPGSANGTVLINGTSDGLVYTPAADFAGAETFDYTITDGLGGFAAATVTVTVNNSNNDGPVLAPVGNRSATEGQTLSFSVSASDVDGAPPPNMSADLSDLPGSPSFTDNNNGTGSFSWTPAAGDAPGPYSVTFTATDALDSGLTSAEIVSIDVQPAGSGSGAYQPDGSGQFVIEAENYDLNTGSATRDWVDDFTPGFVGAGAMQSVPDSFSKVNSNLNANSPRMDYEVELAAGATFNVWIRGVGLSGSRDSLWIGANSNDGAAQIASLNRGSYGWTPAGQLSLAAGVQTVNVWMREDGSIIDRVLLTPLASTPSGDGPPESSRGGGGGPPRNDPPVLAPIGDQTAVEGSTLIVNVSASDATVPALSATFGTLPGWFDFLDNGNGTGTFSWTPSVYAVPGPHSVTFTATDSVDSTLTSSESINIYVEPLDTNVAPVLAPIGDRTTIEGSTLIVNVSATDATVPVLSANFGTLPGAPNFVDNGNGTGTFYWLSSVGDAPGPYFATFTAWDSEDSGLSTSETIRIDVQIAPPPPPPVIGVFQPDGDGQFVMEAENFDANAGAGGRDWISDKTTAYVGDSAMQSVPDSYTKVTTNLNANSPRMDYQFELAAPATLNVWVRGLGLSGSRDSAWVGVNGNDAAAQFISLSRNNYGWTTSGQISLPAGVHTFNVWMREDGSFIDRILLTPLSTVPSGDGPPESTRSGVGGSVLPLADDFADGNADGWTIVDDSTQFPSNWSVVNQAYVQSEHTNSNGKDVTETYHRGSYAIWDASAGTSDYRFSVDVTPAADSGDDIGVMFRYVDANNYYRFTLNLLNGFARLEKKVNGTYMTLSSDHRGYIPGALSTIVVEAEGPLMQIFVNDDPLFAASDTAHGSGGVALFSRDHSTFDSVSLVANGTEPQIVIATPEAHSVLPGAPLDLDIGAVVRNVPGTNSSVFFLYRKDGVPFGCNTVSVFSPSYVTARCNDVPAGDYSVEAILFHDGIGVDSDSNEGVAVGSPAFLSHRYDAIGNSITRGVGDNTASDNLAVANPRVRSNSGWTSLLSDLLAEATGSPNLVGNEGISGDRITDVWNTRLFSIIERNPESDRALVILGTNDSNTFNTLSVADFTTNLQNIIDELHLSGRDMVHVALLPPAWGRNNNPVNIYPDPLAASATRNQTIISYNTAIQSMLPQSGVQLGPDFFNCFLTPTVNRFSLFEDPLHPNALGHKFMAELWEDAIMGGPIVPPVDPCPSPIFILDDLDAYAHNQRQNLLEEGDKYYRDAAFTLTNIPPELADGIWVQNENADNTNADADFLSFSVGSTSSTVYIAYDLAGAPPTSATHTFTADTLSEPLTTSDAAVGTFGIVSAGSVTGTVTIGGTKSAGSPAAQQTFLVIVVAD